MINSIVIVTVFKSVYMCQHTFQNVWNFNESLANDGAGPGPCARVSKHVYTGSLMAGQRWAASDPFMDSLRWNPPPMNRVSQSCWPYTRLTLAGGHFTYAAGELWRLGRDRMSAGGSRTKRGARWGKRAPSLERCVPKSTDTMVCLYSFESCRQNWWRCHKNFNFTSGRRSSSACALLTLRIYCAAEESNPALGNHGFSSSRFSPSQPRNQVR